MAEGLRHCESPLCSVEFEPSGLKMEPKRFCSDRCKQEASLIRRVAALYRLEVEVMHEVLTNLSLVNGKSRVSR